MNVTDPIDAYSAELVRRSAGRTDRGRRALAEMEDHLRE